MTRYIIFTLHRDYLALFDFLKDNPTMAYKKGDYYRLVYAEPLDSYLTGYCLPKLSLEVTETTDGKLAGWELIRGHQLAYAGAELLVELADLERHELIEQQQGLGLSLSGWVLDVICYGIATKQEKARLVRAMFVTGYAMEQVIGFYSTVTRRQELNRYFLQELARLYQYEGVVS